MVTACPESHCGLKGALLLNVGHFLKEETVAQEFQMSDLNSSDANKEPNILRPSHDIHAQTELLKEAGCKIEPGKPSPR